MINARLVGVTYSNDLLLIGFGVFQTEWARIPINMIVITQFSVLTTVLTYFFLKPFAGQLFFLLLLPAVFATPDYPRKLAWLGAAEWGIASLATVLLVAAPGWATAPLLISFALYAPWVWGSAVWLLRRHPVV